MQQTFLNCYPELLTSKPSQQTLTGLWLAHGDEPLLHDWLIDAMHPLWQAHNQAIRRIELQSSRTWQDVLAELSSLSLFADANALVITGNHKPDKTQLSELLRFAQDCQHNTTAHTGNPQHCLLWLLPKQDKRSQSSRWFAPFAEHGRVIDCHLYNEQQRQQLLHIQAQRFGLQLNTEAWQLLLTQTQNHLLAAYQTLWRLSYLLAPKLAELTPSSSGSDIPLHINADDLQAALVSDQQYSVFDLSDAMLAGDQIQVLHIFKQLQATDEPASLILWVIAKDMRLLQQLHDGKPAQSLGIWRSKQHSYQQASLRLHHHNCQHWQDLLLSCDQAIKGVINQPAHELLLQAALAVTGMNLFTHRTCS